MLGATLRPEEPAGPGAVLSAFFCRKYIKKGNTHMFAKPTEDELRQLEELTKEYDTRIEQAADEEEKKALRDECSEKLTDLFLEIDQRHFEKIATSPDAILEDAKSQIETAILHAYEGLIKYGKDREKYMSFATGEARLFSQAAAECAKIELVLHFDALKDNPEYTKRLFALIAEIVKTSEYTDNEEITLVSELHHPAEVEPVIAWAILKGNIPTYHGKAVDMLARFSSRDIVEKTRTNRGVIESKEENYKVIINNLDKLKGKLSINTHKLLFAGIAEFTRLNNSNCDTAYRIVFPLKDYARILNYKIDECETDTPEAAAKEKKRARQAYKNAKRSISEDVHFLMAMDISWQENTKEGPRDFDSIHLLDRGAVRDGYIIMEFGRNMAEYLKTLPLTQYPQALFSIDARNPNAYRMGFKMVEHYNMLNNQIKKNATRLRVSTLLKETDLPTIDDLRNEAQDDSRHWKDRTKKYFEKALDALTGKVIKSWKYTREKGKPITKEEVSKVSDYYTFINLYIEFELLNAPDHTKRIEEKAKAKEKAEPPADEAKAKGKRKKR